KLNSMVRQRLPAIRFSSVRTGISTALDQAVEAEDKRKNTSKGNMRKHTALLITALALTGAALSLTGQDAGGPPAGDRPPLQGGPGGPGGQGGPGGDGHRPPPPPIIAALDANGDGVIDEQEIANASAALRKLDKNGNSKHYENKIKSTIDWLLCFCGIAEHNFEPGGRSADRFVVHAIHRQICASLCNHRRSKLRDSRHNLEPGHA